MRQQPHNHTHPLQWPLTMLFLFLQVRSHLEDLVTNLQSSKMTLEDQLNREVGGVFCSCFMKTLISTSGSHPVSHFCLCNSPEFREIRVSVAGLGLASQGVFAEAMKMIPWSLLNGISTHNIYPRYQGMFSSSFFFSSVKSYILLTIT